ncbi:MAG: hypothetical protein NTW05_29370, partial [Pseudonocardiales bacterium]|nr:hypothetical protein [Pseudonocardiales bacterium]
MTGGPRSGGDRPRTDRAGTSGGRPSSRPGQERDDRSGDRRRSPIPDTARASFVVEPPLPDDVAATDLDAEVRRDLRGLQKDTADSVARHLVAAGSLVDEDPELALEHARFARRRASRIAVVREAAGIAAYHAGEWTEALAELRAARRMGGGPVHVPVMADIERALGRPERAIDLARSPEASELGAAERIELAIVAAGARRDLGEVEASVVALQIPELDPARRDPWSARLFYAYADNLLAAGRDSDAVQWFVHAADADLAGETDAAHRIGEITGDAPDDELDDIAFGEEDAPATATGGSGTPADDLVADEGQVGDPPVDEVAVDEPAVGETAAGESARDGIAADELAFDDSAVDETAVDETAADESAAEETAADGTAVGEPRVVDEAAVGEPAVDEAAVGEPPADEAAVDGRAVSESAVDTSVVDEVAVDEVAVDEVAADEAPVDEPVVDEYVVDESAVDQAPVDEVPADEAPVGESAVG